MIKIINVYKDSRVMEMTTSSNLGLGVKTDNDVDLLRFTFDDFIVGTATLLTTLTDSNGELVAFPLTINQEENSYDLEVTQYVASELNYTIQIEIVNDDMVWHSKQADITLDECLEIGEGEMPTTIENWLQNANIVLSEMEQATRETENLNIEVGTETSTTIPVTFTDKEGNQTTVNVKGARGEKGEQGIPGSPGTPGQDATINGVNTLTIQEGENISITQSGSTMTISSTGGSGGTSDYTDLTNKPSINNVTLSGNKSLSDLGIQPSGDYITNTDYATSSNGGVVKVDGYYGVDDTDGGRIRASNYTYSQYESKSNNAFISKGTLENVVTGKGLVTQSGVMTYLGDCGDYSTSNYLDITGIKKGIYVLSAHEGNAISLQMTFKGTTSTARYTQVGTGDRLFGYNYYIYISQDVTDELEDNVTIGYLTFNTMGGGTNYDLKTRKTTIRLTNKMLDLGNSSYDTRNLNLVDKEQSISRKKTFSVLPESSVTPTTNNQLVNKKYVDDSIASAITDALGGSY